MAEKLERVAAAAEELAAFTGIHSNLWRQEYKSIAREARAMLQQGVSEAKAASWARSIGQPPAYSKPGDRRFDPTPGGYALDLRERVDEFAYLLGKLAGGRE